MRDTVTPGHAQTAQCQGALALQMLPVIAPCPRCAYEEVGRDEVMPQWVSKMCSAATVVKSQESCHKWSMPQLVYHWNGTVCSKPSPCWNVHLLHALTEDSP